MCVHGDAHMWGQVPTDSRQGCWIPWNQSDTWLWTTLHGCWEPDLSPSQEQDLLLAAEPCLQPLQRPATLTCYSSLDQFLVSGGRPQAEPTRKYMLCTYSFKGQEAHTCGTTFDHQVEYGLWDSFSSLTGSKIRYLEWLTRKYSSVYILPDPDQHWEGIKLVLRPKSKPLDECLQSEKLHPKRKVCVIMITQLRGQRKAPKRFWV